MKYFPTESVVTAPSDKMNRMAVRMSRIAIGEYAKENNASHFNINLGGEMPLSGQ